MASEWCQRKEYYRSAVLARGNDSFNEVTRQVCRERQLFCIDLARELPQRAEFFVDDMHFNEAGAAMVAQIIDSRLEAWWASGETHPHH